MSLKLLQNGTNQELFDYAVQGIIDQGGQSAGADGVCQYFATEGDDTMRCAVGQFLPMSLNNRGLDGDVDDVIRMLRDSDMLDWSAALEVKEEFLNTLQTFHDTMSPSDRRESYRCLVKYHGIAPGSKLAEQWILMGEPG